MTRLQKHVLKLLIYIFILVLMSELKHFFQISGGDKRVFFYLYSFKLGNMEKATADISCWKRGPREEEFGKHCNPSATKKLRYFLVY